MKNISILDLAEWMRNVLQHPSVLGIKNCTNPECRIINKNIVLVPGVLDASITVCMLDLTIRNGDYISLFKISPKHFDQIMLDEVNQIILLNLNLALKYEFY